MWCCLVAKSCLTLCDPVDCILPRLPGASVSPGVAQTHVHWCGDAIQPSNPQSFPSPSAFNLSQHQGLFQWVGSSHQVVSVLELQLQHQSFQGQFRVDFLYDGLVSSPCGPRDSQESSPAPQFRDIKFFGWEPQLFSCQEINSVRNLKKLGKVNLPQAGLQRKTQPDQHLSYSLVSAWEENLLKSCADCWSQKL